MSDQYASVMRKPRYRPGVAIRLGMAATVAACVALPAQAAIFNNNFNSDPSGAVTILEPAKWVSSGGVGGSGYISLTDALNDQQGAIIIED
mgnify:FL=1